MVKRVGIYQTTFAKGGRIKVVAAITYVFNQMGIVPDWISFRNTLSEANLNEIISKDIHAKFILLRNFVRGLSEFKYIHMNQRVLKLLREYDVIVNSNNTLAVNPDIDNIINYIHFPREARLIDKYSNSTIRSRLLRHLFHHLYSVYLPNEKPKGVFIVNSEFTKGAMLDVYPLRASDIVVIYPPIERCPVSFDFTQKVKKKVVSIGRFGQEKDQLFQISIAERVPEAQFCFMGYVNNNQSLRYFRLCQRMCESKGIKNVKLIKNVESEIVKKELESASVFLHSMVDEPFGLATVEAIYRGCLPLSHYSGGQREIICDDRFLYSSLLDVETKLTQLIGMHNSETEELSKILQLRVSEYSVDKFIANFTKVLRTMNFV